MTYSNRQFVTFPLGHPPSRGDLGSERTDGRSVPAAPTVRTRNPSPTSDKSKQSAPTSVSSWCWTSLMPISLRICSIWFCWTSDYVRRRIFDAESFVKQIQSTYIRKEERLKSNVREHGAVHPQLLAHVDGPAEQQYEGVGDHPPLALLVHHLPSGLHAVEGVDGSPL